MPVLTSQRDGLEQDGGNPVQYVYSRLTQDAG